jgi:hypothetical protein
MNHMRATFLIAVMGLFVGGCAQQAPRISHVHVGHAITGWHDTPGQKGLFVAAEEKGQSALQHARDANQPGRRLDEVQGSIRRVMADVDPRAAPEGASERYGLKQALQGAVDHLVFAADVDDASNNVRRSVPVLVGNAAPLLARCESILVFGKEAVASKNLEEAKVLAAEILRMTRANADGVDVDGDGVIGSKREEYGLKQLRRDLVAMTQREDPPYTTVSTWYLFNLIRLPSGVWTFREGMGSTGAQRGGYN